MQLKDSSNSRNTALTQKLSWLSTYHQQRDSAIYMSKDISICLKTYQTFWSDTLLEGNMLNVLKQIQPSFPLNPCGWDLPYAILHTQKLDVQLGIGYVPSYQVLLEGDSSTLFQPFSAFGVSFSRWTFFPHGSIKVAYGNWLRLTYLISDAYISKEESQPETF